MNIVHYDAGSSRKIKHKSEYAASNQLAAVIVLASTVWAMAAPHCAAAQAANEGQSPAGGPATAMEQVDAGADIVVTATRRAQTSQTVPIALTAIGSEQLAKQGITSAAQLNQLAPSLYIEQGVASGSPRFSLRGITGSDTAPSGSAAVALYIDDVYQASQFGTGTQLFDLQRIEVLRGPQGTTFGKNAAAGAVAYFSQVPTNQIEGYLSSRLAGGDRAERFLETAINVPIVQGKLAFRVSARLDKQLNNAQDVNLGRGYGRGNSQSGRAQLRWTPTTATAVNLTVFGSERDGGPPLYHADFDDPAFGAIFGAIAVDPDKVALTSVHLYEKYKNYGATLRLEQELGSFNLTAITHYRELNQKSHYDVDGVPADIVRLYDFSIAEQYGQEIRLATDSDQPLSGLIGVYYQHDYIVAPTAITSTEGGPPSDFLTRYEERTRINTHAVFANLKYDFSEKISLIGGIRKSSERKLRTGGTDYFVSPFDWTEVNVLYKVAPPTTPDGVIRVRQRQNAAPWTWDATLNFRPNRRILTFLRAARGFRSGGFNPAPVFFGSNVAPGRPYAPEFIESYEGGFKTDLGRALRVNGSIFYYDYQDQQVSSTIDAVYQTANAATASVKGGELEIVTTPVSGVDLQGSLGYSDAKFNKYDPGTGVIYDNNRLANAPKWTINGTAGYTLVLNELLDLRTSTNWSYRSSIFVEPTNDPRLRSKSVAIGNFRIALTPRDKGAAIAAFVNNVNNKKSQGYGFVIIPGSTVKTFSAGRLYGIDLSFSW